jgi:beta-aspartyl-peptidase (threonine type)
MRCAALLLSLCVSASNTDDSSAIEKAVRGVLETQQADWNRGDLDGFMNGYWNSPKTVFQSGAERFNGWETVRARFHKRYKEGGAAMGTLDFSGVEVEVLGPESALARGRWRLTMPDGKKPGGLFTVILRKQADGWKIVHDHTSTE